MRFCEQQARAAAPHETVEVSAQTVGNQLGTALPQPVRSASPVQREDTVEGPIVVGFDGSPESAAAADWAAREAVCRGLPLALVQAWPWPPRHVLGARTP